MYNAKLIGKTINILIGVQLQTRLCVYFQRVSWLLEEMKKESPTFQKVVYAGSFYKGTKYGQPDEFDLNLVFKFPIDYSALKVSSMLLPST